MADISKIKLPSGNEYDIKDAVARQMIAGGVSFNIVWTAAEYTATTAPTTGKLASIPAGVVVYYNNGASSATGTLEASTDTVGKFYLIYSKTQSGTLDVFDEYVTIGEETRTWEKIGDTLIDLSGVVTNVTLNKSTDTVIGSDATFEVTQPSITLSSSETSSTGAVSVVGSLSQSTNYIGASATGANTAWNSKDQKTVLTEVSATKSHLATSTIYGVGSSTTTASKATAGTSQTTATGAGTATTNNTDWLKGCSVTDEVLTIGAASMNTQSTTQYTFSDVTVPIKNSTATTFATGSLATSGGAEVATDVSASSTDSVIGADATFTVTQPTITVSKGTSSGTGKVSVVESSATNAYLTAAAANGAVAWNSKDQVTVLKSDTSITVTKGE